METKTINVSILLVFFTFLMARCKEKVEPKIIEVDGSITDVQISDTLYLDKSEKIKVFYQEDCHFTFKRFEKKLSDSLVSYKIFMNKTENSNDVCTHGIYINSFADSIIPKKIGLYKIIVNDSHLIKIVCVK